MTQKEIVSEDAIQRIWAEDGFRVFLSHKSEVKNDTAILKDELKKYGIACFVAHEDIHPTELWQSEIENALETMDGLVALMTENFHSLIDAYHMNSQLAGCYGFNGKKTILFGSGLVHFLNQWSSRTFQFDSEWYIQQSEIQEDKQ